MTCVMSGRMGFSEEDRRKNAGLTVVLAVLCALGIIMPRSFGSSATVIMAGGRPFAYTDAFIILAAGIGGLPAGILTFSIAFKGLLLHVNAAPDLPRKLFGDDNRIKQCVLNLLTDEIFRELFGMDIGKAIKNCGDKDIFIETAKIFQTYTEENAGKIESLSARGDWKNYTILVHALKSSARLMGMEKLSDDARRLEELGKKAQENDREAVSLITEATPSLLESYRSCGMKLKTLVDK